MIEFESKNYESHRRVTDLKYYKDKYLLAEDEQVKRGYRYPSWKMYCEEEVDPEEEEDSTKTQKRNSEYTLFTGLYGYSWSDFFQFVMFTQFGKIIESEGREDKKETFYMNDSLCILSKFIEKEIVIKMLPQLKGCAYLSQIDFSEEGRMQRDQRKKNLDVVEWFSESSNSRKTSMHELYQELDVPKFAIVFFDLEGYIRYENTEERAFYKPSIIVHKILLLNEANEEICKRNLVAGLS